jgi:hypothetical protein
MRMWIIEYYLIRQMTASAQFRKRWIHIASAYNPIRTLSKPKTPNTVPPEQKLHIRKIHTPSPLPIPKRHTKRKHHCKRERETTPGSRLCTWLDLGFNATLLCEALCAGPSATSLVGVPVEFPLEFVVSDDRSRKVTLTGAFAVGLSRGGSFDGKDRGGSGRSWGAAGRQERRHGRIRQLFEGEEPASQSASHKNAGSGERYV